jgi:hypothetical protein
MPPLEGIKVIELTQTLPDRSVRRSWRISVPM